MKWENAVPGWTFIEQTLNTERGEAGLFVKMEGNFHTCRDPVMYYGLFLANGDRVDLPTGYTWTFPRVKYDGSLVI